MKPWLVALVWLALEGAPGAWAGDLGVFQESAAGVQFQTVQATGYWGSVQASVGLGWTLGVDWDRWLAVRAGLTARSVSTSPVNYNTVYPGYQGWGWTLGFDALPWRASAWGAEWALGATLGGGYEYLEYPGLYRAFELPSLTFGPLGEVVPGGMQGLAFRLRLPVSLDQREGFRLAWRVGLEASVIFRGIGWTFE